MIQERYCSFEVAKLLKEKGFNELCFRLVREDGEIIEVPSREWDRMSRKQKIEFYPCPTHQMACDYLRKKYDLHIIVYPYKANDKKKWCCQVFEKYYLLGYERYMNETLDSFKEAIETALKYSLTELV